LYRVACHRHTTVTLFGGESGRLTRRYEKKGLKNCRTSIPRGLIRRETLFVVCFDVVCLNASTPPFVLSFLRLEVEEDRKTPSSKVTINKVYVWYLYRFQQTIHRFFLVLGTGSFVKTILIFSFSSFSSSSFRRGLSTARAAGENTSSSPSPFKAEHST